MKSTIEYLVDRDDKNVIIELSVSSSNHDIFDPMYKKRHEKY